MENHHTTSSGNPYSAYKNSELNLENTPLIENIAHLNRERIPERVTHAKGAGAFGQFTVTENITNFTKAKLFSEVGKRVPVFVRFSNYRGEKGYPDTVRDPRGIAIKFYTEQGNWDLTANNIPIFFIRDPEKLMSFVHSQKRDPETNLFSANNSWDFFSNNPESIHAIIMNYSERGLPKSYRHIHGFSCHAFTLENEKGEKTWVKFHLLTEQGIENLSREDAAHLAGINPDYYQEDLFVSIQKNNFPKWKLMAQFLNNDDIMQFETDPFDVTKVWPKSKFPLHEIGILELNRNPENYFAEVEQSAFSPANIVSGIGFSPDRLLQARLFAYGDAQRYRLGVNYHQIGVNKPRSGSKNNYRDGNMRVDSNSGAERNYSRSFFISVENNNSFPQKEYVHDDYFQPRNLYNIMKENSRKYLISSISDELRNIDREIQKKMVSEFIKVDKSLGFHISEKLDLMKEEISFSK